MALSPDGSLLASTAWGAWTEIKIWDAKAGRLRRTLTGHRQEVTSLAFHPRNPTVAASAGRDGLVLIWDLETGESESLSAPDAGATSKLAFSPDGKFLLTAPGGWDRPGEILVWDLDGKKVAYSLRGHGKPVTALAFGSGGERLVTKSVDGSIKVWDASGREELLTLGRVAGFNEPTLGEVEGDEVVLSEDGRYLLSPVGFHLRTWDRRLRIWDGSPPEGPTIRAAEKAPP
jgi:WD40 repeat protein